MNSEHNKELEKKLEKLIDGFAIDDKPDMKHKIQLRSEVLKEFEKASSKKVPIRMQSVFNSRTIKFAAAAVVIFALILALNYNGGIFESAAWAEVAEHFESIPFCSAVIYIRDNITSQPQEVELWFGIGRKMRMKIGSELVFARNGQLTHAFNIAERRQVKPSSLASEITDMLSQTDRFSLNTIIDLLSGRRLVDVTPLINPKAVISKDLFVFDLELDKESSWLRLWVLCESKLPVAIKKWNPKNGECIDVSITYSIQQPSQFFDPNFFISRLYDSEVDTTALAYSGLYEPRERPTVSTESPP